MTLAMQDDFASLSANLLRSILPPQAVVVAAFKPDWQSGLTAEEESLVRSATVGRRQEFAAARNCARQAMAEFGVSPSSILAEANGSAIFPARFYGSITHTKDFCAASVIESRHGIALGIDAEPRRPLGLNARSTVVSHEEEVGLRRAYLASPSMPWDTIIFSIKEAIYKCLSRHICMDIEFDCVRVAVDEANNGANVDFRDEQIAAFVAENPIKIGFRTTDALVFSTCTMRLRR